MLEFEFFLIGWAERLIVDVAVVSLVVATTLVLLLLPQPPQPSVLNLERQKSWLGDQEGKRHLGRKDHQKNSRPKMFPDCQILADVMQ